MCRSFFLAMGVYCCILGAECLAVEKAVMKKRFDAPPPEDAVQTVVERREIVPPVWAPWSLISTGAVVLLYSFSIPNRVKT